MIDTKLLKIKRKSIEKSLLISKNGKKYLWRKTLNGWVKSDLKNMIKLIDGLRGVK